MEASFVEAAFAEQAASKGPAEICAVLNRLPASANETDAERIRAIDALMESLYQRRILTFPAHRWLATHVASISGQLVQLFEKGHIRRDARTGRWKYSGQTSYFVVWRESEIRARRV